MTKSPDKRLSRNYDRAAWFYESSAAVFSLGQIRAAKRYAVNQLQPGERVIFLGAGTGEDAIMAAERGCQVTCLDISQRMLDRLQHRLTQRGLKAEIICQNAFEFDRIGHYDACAANFFLNVFRQAEMRQMLKHAASLVRPGGKFLVADVALAQGNPVWQAFNIVYLKTAMVSFWLLGLVPLHRNYDYASLFPSVGLKLDHVQHFRFFPAGPIVYQVTVGIRTP